MSRRERAAAERMAALLGAAFEGSGATCDAVRIGEAWYAVTRDTGEGQDYAYDPSESDLDALEAEMATEPVEDEDEDGGTGGWNYSSWCARTAAVCDCATAARYYLATGRHLGNNGGRILSDRDVAMLNVSARAVTDDQIEALAGEAGDAGDLVCVAVAEVALGRDPKATVDEMNEHQRYLYEQTDLRCDEDGAEARARALCASFISEAEAHS